MTSSVAALSSDVTTARGRLVQRYFLAVSIAMLAILVLGFTPTLLFRSFFDVPPIPAYLYIHGIVLIAWYVWFLVQATLVFVGRQDLHRRSGVVGVVITACVVAVILVTIVKYIPRMRAIGTDFGTEGSRLASGVVGDTLTLLQFIPLIVLAVLWRGRPATYKRLMLLASLAILGPAGSRTPAAFAALGLSPVAAPFVAYVLFTIAAPVVYDILTLRRLHVATLICVPANFAAVVLSFAIAGNESARATILSFF